MRLRYRRHLAVMVALAVVGGGALSTSLAPAKPPPLSAAPETAAQKAAEKAAAEKAAAEKAAAEKAAAEKAAAEKAAAEKAAAEKAEKEKQAAAAASAGGAPAEKPAAGGAAATASGAGGAAAATTGGGGATAQAAAGTAAATTVPDKPLDVGKLDERLEALRQRIDERKKTHDARKQADQEKIRIRWGALVTQPAVVAELKTYGERVARLTRIQELSEVEAKPAVRDRAKKALALENARHEKQMNALAAGGAK